MVSIHRRASISARHSRASGKSIAWNQIKMDSGFRRNDAGREVRRTGNKIGTDWQSFKLIDRIISIHRING
jgi:hypothetical protein